MIDIMFFLLVFFMISTLYMVNLKTVDIQMPKAQTAEMKTSVTYLVTMKKDGSLWLEDKPIKEAVLIKRSEEQTKHNPKFSVVVRADEGAEYGRVIALLDKLKAAGVTRFGLAADSGGQAK